MTSAFDPLDLHEIRVLAVRLKSLTDRAEVLRRMLSPEELAREGRLRKNEDRTRFASCRGFLRFFLGSIAGADPAALSFTYGTTGKPFLGSPFREFFFNVAHSGDWAVFAATRTGDVGVDVESWRPSVDQKPIVARYFPTEEQRLWEEAGAARQSSLFFEMWTRHEALVKAMGVGMLKRESLPPLVNASQSPPLWTYECGGKIWWVRPLNLKVKAEKVSGAVAGLGEAWRNVNYYQNDNYVIKCLNKIVNT